MESFAPVLFDAGVPFAASGVPGGCSFFDRPCLAASFLCGLSRALASAFSGAFAFLARGVAGHSLCMGGIMLGVVFSCAHFA